MNKIPLNIAGLDGGVIIKKGGGGGATIKNQEKSVDITENGVTEVTADAGFTGLSRVIVNTNVASSGGGGSDMPVIGDGKTYLYIKIAAEGKMNVPLYFNQSLSNGVTIDWGDGSAPQTISSKGNKIVSHKYAETGDYVISLDPVDGCTLRLGHATSSSCVMGSPEYYGRVYCNMLQAVEIGKNVTSIGDYAFKSCSSLASIVIPEGVTSIGSSVFSGCSSLASIVIPESVTSVGNEVLAGCAALASLVIPDSFTSIYNYMVYNCYSLASVVIPEGVTSIGNYAFAYCYGMAFLDFSSHTSVPSLGSNVFSDIPSGCKIIVPDALYDTWIAATNWSTYASNIIKKSDWDASQS